jgi:hypothetical protein
MDIGGNRHRSMKGKSGPTTDTCSLRELLTGRTSMNQPPLPDDEPSSGDPLAELNRRMRLIRHNSGLSYERMSHKVFRSKTVLANADKGARVPEWDLLTDYITAILDESAEAALADLQPVWRAAHNQRSVPRQRTRASVRPGRPSPGEATDPATYVRMLDQLRNSAGPTLRVLSVRAGLAKSTLNDRFSWKRLWPRDVTERYLRACELDDAGVAAWLAAYDRLTVVAEPLPAPAPDVAAPVAAEAEVEATATATAAATLAEPPTQGQITSHRLFWVIAAVLIVAGLMLARVFVRAVT